MAVRRPCPDAEIEMVRLRVTDVLPFDPHLYLEIGMEVEVVSGPFAVPAAVAPVLACEMMCKPLRFALPLFRRRQVRAFSIAKAEKELGYRPTIRIKRAWPDFRRLAIDRQTAGVSDEGEVVRVAESDPSCAA